jgi:hypothetical protein
MNEVFSKTSNRTWLNIDCNFYLLNYYYIPKRCYGRICFKLL